MAVTYPEYAQQLLRVRAAALLRPGTYIAVIPRDLFWIIFSMERAVPRLPFQPGVARQLFPHQISGPYADNAGRIRPECVQAATSGVRLYGDRPSAVFAGGGVVTLHGSDNIKVYSYFLFVRRRAYSMFVYSHGGTRTCIMHGSLDLAWCTEVEPYIVALNSAHPDRTRVVDLRTGEYVGDG